MKSIDDLFWDATIEELKQGYLYNQERGTYICLICGEKFTKGVIYPYGDYLVDAERGAKLHIEEKHGSIFDYLIQMNKKYTGLTDIQRELLSHFYEGLSDKEITDRQGGGSTSTIRNHRFKLKEKEKQAKVFLAIMALLDNKKDKKEYDEDEFISIHKGATMVDDRYAITEREREKVIKNYFKEGDDGKLSIFPSKEKKKIIILQHIMKNFKPDRKYIEKEVNTILKGINPDYATLRRYLIEYGFMERSRDCSTYWVKN